VLTTNQKGLIAETAIIHECVKRGIGVARPLDDAPYDLILDLGPKLLRVQCKWAVRQGDVMVIRTRRCRRGREGHIHRSYGAAEIDAIAAYCQGTGCCYLLPHELSVDRALVHLRLAPAKNNQIAGIRWARDHELGGTLTRLLGP
jgi:hypothetical protein